MSRVKPMAAMAGGAKPFVWFGRACDSLTEADVATIRGRLVRELAHVLSYMAVSDLEKPNEPVVVLFTRLPPEVIRPHLINPPRAGAGAGAGGTELSATETARLRSLRRAVEEARGVLNPRLLLLIPVASPWTWTFVFLRSHERLRPALHRLAPAAAQLVADRHVLLLPRLAVLDDLTPGAEVVARLRHRVAQALRPLLTWMAEEGEVEAAGGGGGSGGGGGGGGGGGQPQAAAPGPEGRGGAGGGAPEKLPVLFVAADVDLLAQRFVTATEAPPPPPPPQPLSVSGERSPAPGAAPTGGAHALRASLDMSIEGWDEAVPAYCEAARAAGGLGGGGGAAAAAASWGAPQSEGLADLGGAEMQRLLLARDRLYDVIKVMRPRLLVLVNWIRPTQWVVVLVRRYSRLLAGLAAALPDRTVYVWAPRRLPRPTDAHLTDVCYSNACPRRGQLQPGVKFCPHCLTAKYCSIECQNEHWHAGHCRLCPRLVENKLGQGGGAAAAAGGQGPADGGTGRGGGGKAVSASAGPGAGLPSINARS